MSAAASTAVPLTATAPATPKPTITSESASAPSFVTQTAPPESYWDRFPKDEKGRVIGGRAAPVINYSPTMVTGKKCPRIKKWGYKLQVDRVVPNQPVAEPDNPCVIQNAIDDYVRTLYAQAAENTPETMKQVSFDDPALIRGWSPFVRRLAVQAQQQNKQLYRVCNKRMFRLVDVTRKALLMSDMMSEVRKHLIQIRTLLVAQDLEPYECSFFNYVDDALVMKRSLTAEAMQAGGEVTGYSFVLLGFNQDTGTWQSNGNAQPVLESKGYYASTAQKLWQSLAIKP
jgi:hypothetical protein